MAQIFPSIAILKRQKVQPTEGEWALINFLVNNLDNSYEVFVQPFLNGDQPDIVVMRKGSGVLIIEVKDWDLRHYCIDENTNWHLFKDNTKIKSPLYQVEKYKENLFNLHSEELYLKKVKNKNLWATVNCAVYFHNAKQEQVNSFLLDDFQGSNYDRYRKFISYFGLIGSDSLNLGFVMNLFSRYYLNKKSYYFDDSLYKGIRRYLMPPIHQIEDGKEIIYTKEQQQLIRSEIRPRRKIKGVAGCGKTLVLAKRAVNAYLRTNSRILILTYNLSLKNYIHDKINDVREEFPWSNFYIDNYHQFFKKAANNYGLEITSLGSWDDKNFFKSVERLIKPYDVVLIDEIQDYKQAWIDIIVEYFTNDNTELVVFGDEKQNIYNRELDENNEIIVRQIPARWNKSLNTSHRFSSNIGNLALKFQKTIFNMKYSPDDINFLATLDFEQRLVEYHSFTTESVDAILKVMYNVLERNEIHSSDSCVLSSKVEVLRELDYLIRSGKKESTCTTFESKEEYATMKGNDKKIEDHRRFKKSHFWMKTGTVKLSTTHSFKGWEIDTLFLIIENEEDNEFTNAELIYTALTRAKRNLIVMDLGNHRYENFFLSEVQSCYKHSDTELQVH
ncbi:UvrD-helicase domain-containing protein [Carboxylicivirga sp. RSCT41]|uniref:nuclease-related domain-containing DEAD/DEAH box helicase n=1 Tax=Carboxylicivirga agarovorans TaxID=3417570 RepID=UPI003D350CA7